MNRPTPMQFACVVYQMSMALPGQDLAFAPRPAGALDVCYAQMWRCDVQPVCEAVAALAATGLPLGVVAATWRQPCA